MGERALRGALSHDAVLLGREGAAQLFVGRRRVALRADGVGHAGRVEGAGSAWGAGAVGCRRVEGIVRAIVRAARAGVARIARFAGRDALRFARAGIDPGDGAHHRRIIGRFAQAVELDARLPFRKPHAPCECLGGGQVDVAVAVRVLAQVVLVVVLGCVEAVERLDLGDDGLGVARLLAAQRRLDGGQVGLVLPVDAAAVLRARVVALAVKARGVHDLEEAVEQHVGG